LSTKQVNIEQVILRLEQVKLKLADCHSLKELLSQIDSTMETLINFQGAGEAGLAASKGDIVTRLRYLRELRASALDLAEEQVHDFSRDLSLIISSMQFQLWSGESKELISLIESSKS
jgi:hypothetical protein